jgi:hypothetical protein
MKKLIFTMLAGSMLVFNSCSKTGPQGPAGPQGIQGATGPAGPAGNANVLGSDPFTVNVGTWLFSSSDNAFYTSFTDADITNAVAAHGVVQVYLFYPGDGTWRSLPDIVNGTQFYDRFSSGGFEIYYGNVDGTTPTAPTTNFTFRVVVISPSQRQAHPNTNWKNYNEAMAALKSDNASTTMSVH